MSLQIFQNLHTALGLDPCGHGPHDIFQVVQINILINNDGYLDEVAGAECCHGSPHGFSFHFFLHLYNNGQGTTRIDPTTVDNTRNGSFYGPKYAGLYRQVGVQVFGVTWEYIDDNAI